MKNAWRALLLIGPAEELSKLDALASNFAGYPNPSLQKRFHCPSCGSDAAKPIQKCEPYGQYITTPSGLRTIVHHFAAASTKTFLGLPLMFESSQTDGGRQFHIHTSADRKAVGFDLTTLNRLIEISNQQAIERIESHGRFPKQWLHSQQAKRQLS